MVTLAAAFALAACATSPETTVSTLAGERWELDSRVSDFNRQITIYLDGEVAMRHHFVPMPPAGSSGRGEFRGHALRLHCRPNPIVYGVDCVLGMDGRTVAHLQHVF
ncbi:MAG: hypothetical protein JJT90_09670 [Ectothiorhodospiraceae bacterium]|nr:hypothetical protein [Ectothiorhodospiraceae bacterium]